MVLEVDLPVPRGRAAPGAWSVCSAGGMGGAQPAGGEVWGASCFSSCVLERLGTSAGCAGGCLPCTPARDHMNTEPEPPHSPQNTVTMHCRIPKTQHVKEKLPALVLPSITLPTAHFSKRNLFPVTLMLPAESSQHLLLQPHTCPGSRAPSQVSVTPRFQTRPHPLCPATFKPAAPPPMLGSPLLT